MASFTILLLTFLVFEVNLRVRRPCLFRNSFTALFYFTNIMSSQLRPSHSCTNPLKSSAFYSVLLVS